MQIISVINQKGGVGKTTTVINLAASLAQKEKKILIIDLDPQGNATTGLGLSNLENSGESIYGVLNGSKSISEVIKKTNFKNLDIVTSNVDLSGLEVETAGDSKRAFILKGELTVVVSKNYTNNEPESGVDIINQANKYLKKYSLKDVVELISKKEKISKKKVYEICLKIKNEKKNN